MFPCGGIIRLSGVEFVFERAQVDPFTVDADAGAPALHVIGPVDAFVFRARVPFETAGRPAVKLSSVPDVLRVRRGAEVGLTIVKAVMVDVVAEHAGRDSDDQMVHLEVPAFFFLAVGQRVHGVPGVRALVGVPFDPAKPVVVFGIDEGELALGQRDASERVAVAHPAIGQHEPEKGLLQPGRDVQNDLDDSLLRSRSELVD